MRWALETGEDTYSLKEVGGMNTKRILVGVLFLALLAGVFARPGIQLAGGPTERLTNGDFEAGFHPAPVGYVGDGWQWFDNGGRA